MNWSDYKDRINSVLARCDESEVGTILGSLIAVFGLSDEEFFHMDLMGLDDGAWQAVVRVSNEMREAGIDVT